jgi:DNA-binding LytR/AlgR family response regulator
MNILICDDVPDEAMFISRIIALSVPDAGIQVFYTGSQALDFIRSNKTPDLCFLDIIMPGVDGVSLAQKMREAGYKGPIVFLTSSNEFAAQSYKVEAFSYLLKPPNEQEIMAVLHKVETMQNESDTAGIPVRTKPMSRFILFRDISHVEVIDKKVFFRLKDGTETQAWATLSDIAPKLFADDRFAQCHRSFVVNMDDVSYIEGRTIVMKCGKKIPMAKNFADFKKQYEKRMFIT